MSLHAKAKNPFRWLRLAGLVAIPLAFSVAGGAWAFWLAGATSTSAGASAATSVNAGATPSAVASGTSVTVSWSASTLATGQAVSGYLVKRYNASTLVAQTILSACTGTVAATSCVESSVPQGSWKYSVTPVFATNWRGAESANSATVVVDNVAPTNALSLSSVSGGAYLTGPNLYYAGASVGSFRITNTLTDATSGPASSQTAALTGTTTGWTHTGSTVSTPTGGPYVSNTFSWTAGTTSGPGEVVTGRDVSNNAATTSLTFINDGTAPSAGTVTYADGITGGTTVSVSFTTGTDGSSGIGTRLLQRAVAPTTDGVCGSYGSFATVTGGTNPTSPLVDSVTLGNCYKYQYVVSDNVGNSTTATSSNVAQALYGAYWSFDEGTGTTASDGTGMGNTQSLQAAAGWTTGRTSNALSVTGGSTSYAQTALPVVDTSKSYSVSVWVKLNSTAGYQTFAALDGTNISPFNLQLGGGRLIFTQRTSDSTGTTNAVVQGVTAVTGEWYHVVGVYNQTANTIQLYVNGISQGTTTATTAWKANGPTSIGRSKWGGIGSDYVNGAIDEVHFYDRAITGAEVVALRGAFGGYWALNSSSGTTATDSSGNANTGTLQAGASWTTGKVGSNAVSLNGTSTGYVDINTPVIDTSQSYTAAAWVKFNNVTGFQSLVSIDGASVSPFYLQLDGGPHTFRFQTDSSDATGATFTSVNGVTPVAGTWYHVAGVYNKAANSIQLYVNGVSQGTATVGTTWTASGHTSIGRAIYNGAQVDFVNGAIDEARLYDRALSAAEVAAIADADGPTNSIALSSVTGGAYLSGTNLYYAGAAGGSLRLTNTVTDAAAGAASSSTAALTGTTTGWTHTPSTVSTPTGGPYVSNTFTWAPATTSGPGEVVTGADLSGNTTATGLTFVNDDTAPSAGTVTYANGLTAGTSVSVSFTTGTDAGSGLGTRLLQRAAAPATQAGACGTYGAFATVSGGTNPTSPVTDTVAIGFCYKYQYVVSDNVGNSTTASNANVARAPYGASYALNENTGTSAADGTGMGNTGTLQTGATWTTGRLGSAVSLNGTTGYVDIAKPAVDTSKSYSVSAWVKPTAVNSTDQAIAGISGTTTTPFRLEVTSANRFRFAQLSSDSASPTTTAQVLGPVVVAGEWYHVVGVYDQTANTLELFVNGISQGTTTATTAWAASGHTTIGRTLVSGAGARYFTGAIDEVYFYDRAITAADVVTLRGAFGGYWALNSSSGTTATDSSGNANTGTLQAAAGWTTGKVGSNAVNLNGTSTSYVDVNTPVIDTNQSYTVASWVKFTNVTGFQSLVNIDGTAVSPFYLQLDGTTHTFRFAQLSADSTSATWAVAAGTTPVAGTWYHVAGVYNKAANTVTLYVNGVSQGTVTAVTPWTAYGHTSIGRAFYGGFANDYTNGAIDEARLYDRALSASEISALAGTYSTTILADAGLVNYWRLGDSSGNNAVDSKGSNTGSYVGSPTKGVAGASTVDTNTAVTFNGSSQYITATRSVSGNFSMEVWFKTTQSYSNDLGNPHCSQWWQGAALVDADTGGVANDFGMSLCDGKLVAGAGNTDTSVVSSSAYNNGAWHQAVMTRTQSTGLVTIYVDGVSVGSVTANVNALTAATNFNIARSTGAVNYFSGTLDEISIYNTALSGATVLSHYQSIG